MEKDKIRPIPHSTHQYKFSVGQRLIYKIMNISNERKHG